MRFCLARGCPVDDAHPLSFFEPPKVLSQPGMEVIGRGEHFGPKATQDRGKIYIIIYNLISRQ